jgi:hypothetical protein
LGRFSEGAAKPLAVPEPVPPVTVFGTDPRSGWPEVIAFARQSFYVLLILLKKMQIMIY